MGGSLGEPRPNITRRTQKCQQAATNIQRGGKFTKRGVRRINKKKKKKKKAKRKGEEKSRQPGNEHSPRSVKVLAGRKKAFQAKETIKHTEHGKDKTKVKINIKDTKRAETVQTSHSLQHE